MQFEKAQLNNGTDLGPDRITSYRERSLVQNSCKKFIGGVYGPMADAGMLTQPLDPASEVKSFMTASGMDQKAATEALTNTEAFATGLGN
ncbi:hypothetical protein K1718_10360 [Roseibium porphyridii]|uniref:Uncharacterized protein n=1 Tax=Roseibium porphyridii TaxID=2866279 RepID=A0ABY8F8A2_9HYPH|nr:hypothetical protein [Roseibium sp. KMA01]WFE91737.1 hypothetical protein K1718_10360 [Roseibium sp. KMA01]